ncbi:MAG: hypothetical protein ACE5J3_00845 [Methanosarcinales archaeon]
MEQKNKDLIAPSLLTCAIVGAIGLISGIGIGSAVFVISYIVSVIFDTFIPIIQSVIPITTFAIYGAYLGFAFGNKQKAIQLTKSGAIAGIIISAITSVYALFAEPNLSNIYTFVVIFAIAFAILGMSFGYPNKNKILRLAVYGFISGAIGGTLARSCIEIGNFVDNAIVNDAISASIAISSEIFAILLSFIIMGAILCMGLYYHKDSVAIKIDFRYFKSVCAGILGLIIIVLVIMSLFSYYHDQKYTFITEFIIIALLTILFLYLYSCVKLPVSKFLKSIIIIGIIFAFIIQFFSIGFIFSLGSGSVTYNIYIHSNGTGVITLYAPVLQTSYGSLLKLHRKETFINGNASYEIINTIHGKALKITGTGNIKLVTSQAVHNINKCNFFSRGFKLSMGNNTSTWIYSKISENNTVYIDLHIALFCSGLGIGNIHAIDEEGISLVNGWQKIELKWILAAS